MKNIKNIKNIEWKSITTGAGIAAAGAILTFLTQYVSTVEFGAWTPAITAILSVGVNFIRKLKAAGDEE